MSTPIRRSWPCVSLGKRRTVIPKDRLVAALRHMLDRPQLADLVIPDLARWQDWGSMDKLVDLFKNANEESSWVRVPVVQFLRACPEPKAQEYLVELAKIDPDAVKRATNYLMLPGASGAPRRWLPQRLARHRQPCRRPARRPLRRSAGSDDGCQSARLRRGGSASEHRCKR